MNRIGLKQVTKQLKADLIGKDSYRGITQTYAWLANQFGHFSLGFLFAWIFNIWINISVNSALVSMIFWLAFELVNVLISVFAKTKTNPFVFKPKVGNLVFDTFTDLVYFWLGAIVFLLPSGHPPFFNYILVPIGLYLGFAFWYWYRVKMYLQDAWLPFQFRLSQWRGNFANESDKKVVEHFIENEQSGQLLISGPGETGRTSLAVGIGSELAIKQKAVFYTNLFRLSGDFVNRTNPLSQTGLWSRRDADLLIVDDTNPDNLNWVDTLQFGKLFTDSGEPALMNSKKVIWILNDSSLDSWKTMLVNSGIREESIQTCKLKKNH